MDLRGIPVLVARCSRLIALTEPNQSQIEKLHARAGSRIRVAEPRLRSPAQLDKSSKTRAPFEAQRSTGLILCLHSDNDSTHPIIFVALDPAARCSGQRKGCPWKYWLNREFGFISFDPDQGKNMNRNYISKSMLKTCGIRKSKY